MWWTWHEQSAGRQTPHRRGCVDCGDAAIRRDPSDGRDDPLPGDAWPQEVAIDRAVRG